VPRRPKAEAAPKPEREARTPTAPEGSRLAQVQARVEELAAATAQAARRKKLQEGIQAQRARLLRKAGC
jgi:hypothetical protein